MTQIKKFAWSGAAVALAMIVAMSALVSTAQAAGTVTTTGTTSVSLSTNLATGSEAYTALATAPIVTFSVAAEAAVGETIILTAPAGFQFQDVGVPAESNAFDVGAGALSSNNSVITYTVVTTNAAADTVTFGSLEVRPIFANTVGGTIAVSGTAGATGTAQTLNVTARPTPFTFAFVATPNTTTIAADGTQSVSFAVTVTDDNGGGATVDNTPVTFTAGLGGFGATGAQTTTINTNASGVATVVYKGLGTAGTDTIIAEAAGQVGTQDMTLQTVAAAAGTPTTLAGSSAVLAIAPNNATANPAYTSPDDETTVTFRETDAAGVGVNGRQILVSTNVGRIAAVGACTSASGTSVVLTTATISNVTGRVQAEVCAAASTQVGDITVTARDVALSSVTGTFALTSAGPAATVTSTWNNGVLTVTAKDSAGRNVADGTGIQVTLPTNVGAVSPNADTATVNGQVQFAIALTQATGNAVITVRDSVGGTIRVNSAVNVTTSTTPPAEGDGSLSTPNFGDGNVGSAVFDGGTIEELAAAVTAAGGTAVWVQGTDGNWYRYNTLATGATAFVNNAFNAQFADGLAQSAVFVVK